MATSLLAVCAAIVIKEYKVRMLMVTWNEENKQVHAHILRPLCPAFASVGPEDLPVLLGGFLYRLKGLLLRGDAEAVGPDLRSRTPGKGGAEWTEGPGLQCHTEVSVNLNPPLSILD